MTDLVRYDAMLSAIAECHRVDEVKDIRDKAMAMQVYARQARNTDAERKASDIRLRAERRAGELLKELAQRGERATKGHPKKEMSDAATLLSDIGISRQQSSNWQKLAEVPKEVFEAHLRDPVRKPTTTKIINEARDPVPKMPDDSLWIWGRARDFERDRFADKDPEQLLAGMTETMRADMWRIAPTMAKFFVLLMEALVLNEHA